jgi:hypothetical protein
LACGDLTLACLQYMTEQHLVDRSRVQIPSLGGGPDCGATQFDRSQGLKHAAVSADGGAGDASDN